MTSTAITTPTKTMSASLVSASRFTERTMAYASMSAEGHQQAGRVSYRPGPGTATGIVMARMNQAGVVQRLAWNIIYERGIG